MATAQKTWRRARRVARASHAACSWVWSEILKRGEEKRGGRWWRRWAHEGPRAEWSRGGVEGGRWFSPSTAWLLSPRRRLGGVFPSPATSRQRRRRRRTQANTPECARGLAPREACVTWPGFPRRVAGQRGRRDATPPDVRSHQDRDQRGGCCIPRRRGSPPPRELLGGEALAPACSNPGRR